MIPLNKQIEWLRRCQKVLAGVVGAVLLLFYAVVYRPSTQRIVEIQNQIATTNQQIKSNESAAKDLDKIKRDVQQLRDQIARSRKLTRDQDLSGFLRDVTDLAHGTRVDRFRCEPESVRKLDLCSELPIKLKFAGPFMDVASFLRQAEEMPRMMRTRSLTLKSRDGKDGVVNAELSVSIFFGGDQ